MSKKKTVIHCKYDELVSPKKLKNHPKNRNKHGQDQIDRLAELYSYHGIRHPIIVSKQTGCIVAGHGRKLAAIRANIEEMPVVYQDFDSVEAEYAFIQADNAIALWAELDLAGINADIGDLGPDFDINMLGIQDFTLDVAEKEFDEGKNELSLSERFVVPPFTVLDARQGYWLERKRSWLEKGIDSKLGRDGVKTFNTKGSLRKDGILDDQENVSIFDPVLCELAYRWFTPEGAEILDPFAGGSVRGICASALKRNYTGIDLRKEQVEANIEQAKEIGANPTWICGDSANVKTLTENKEFDFIFSCPPYADLEVYSKDPKDLSNMDYDNFKSAYEKIIRECSSLLKNDRFACFVVGEIRDKKGNYRNFLGDTISAFLDAGLNYYNEACYITPNGTLALRAGKQMVASRKLGKGHQNLLVFVKGDAKKATQYCGEINFSEAADE